MVGLVLPQPGLFALGTPIPTFLEFDIVDPDLATAGVLATISPPGMPPVSPPRNGQSDELPIRAYCSSASPHGSKPCR